MIVDSFDINSKDVGRKESQCNDGIMVNGVNEIKNINEN